MVVVVVRLQHAVSLALTLWVCCWKEHVVARLGLKGLRRRPHSVADELGMLVLAG